MKSKTKKNLLIGIIIIGILALILGFSGIKLPFTITLPYAEGYGYEGNQVSIDISLKTIDNTPYTSSGYLAKGGYAIVVEGSSQDTNWNSLKNDVGTYQGKCKTIYFDCMTESSFTEKQKIDGFISRANTYGKSFSISAPGERILQTVSIPSISGQYQTFKIYAFVCMIDTVNIDAWECRFEDTKRVVGIKRDFCGDISGLGTPTGMIQASSWDNYCYAGNQYINKYSYCDINQKRCTPTCQTCDSLQYCLSRWVSSGDKLKSLIDTWTQYKTKGDVGCVDRNKICNLALDCKGQGYISDNRYNSARCEKSTIPSWLSDINNQITTSTGKFGSCEKGCKLDSDCSDTIGHADDFKVTALGKQIAGESWTCVSSTGECRLNICNHDTDCWTLEKTQMSECELGSCRVIPCTNDCDCWNAQVTGIGTYGYGCVSSKCQLKYLPPIDQNIITPELCTLSRGQPSAGKVWDVSGKCECIEKTVITSECSPGTSASTINSACESAKGRKVTVGYKFICTPVIFGGLTYGSCSEVEIPVTEDCKKASNPEEYCMLTKGLSGLADGQRWTCTENGMCLLTQATCSKSSDCQVGGIGGTCVNGLCRYGISPPVPPPVIVCGDKVCDVTETAGTCPEDCRKIDWEANLLWILPVIIALGISLLIGYQGKLKTGKYSVIDFIIGAIFGGIIGTVVFLILKYWLFILLAGIIGGGVSIAIILILGGLPLLIFLLKALGSKLKK